MILLGTVVDTGGGGGTPAKLCRQSKLYSKMTPLYMNVPTGTGWPNVQYVSQAQPPVKYVMINIYKCE